MIFGGFVPLRRGLIEHTADGRLTNNEALVFVWLLMLADHKTGSYTINGPTLRVFLPGLNKSAAQRALEGLERKQYIYRDIKPRSPLVYPYFIEGFQITDGPHKMSQLDLSEVFATKDISKVRYLKSAPDTELGTGPATGPDTGPDTANYNKKEEGEVRKKTENPLLIGTGKKHTKEAHHGSAQQSAASEAHHEAQRGEHQGSAPRMQAMVSLKEAHHGESHGESHGDSDGDSAPSPTGLPFGVTFRNGHYWTPQGVRIPPESERMIDAVRKGEL